MNHVIFEQNDTYEVALLIKETALRKPSLLEHYVKPLKKLGVKPNSIVAFDLVYPNPKKVPVSIQKAYLTDLLLVLKDTETKILAVADTNYFKTLTNEKKAEPHYGYVLPCAIKGHEDKKVVLLPNYQALFFNPAIQDKVDMGLKTLADYLSGNYKVIGKNIIHKALYYYEPQHIYTALNDIKEHPSLSCDIETFSLNFWEAGIRTITFCWDTHEGIAFPVDSVDKVKNHKVRRMLLDFFYSYQGVLIYHNANYDIKVLIYELFMEDLLDERGKQTGIEILTRSFQDTKLIAYLATNSCAGNKLSLKDLAHEFAGNYALEDIKDVTLIPEPKLLEYNLIDGLCTNYVFRKFYPQMIADQQLPIYEQIMKPSVKVILQMELTGMPINMPNVVVARSILEKDIAAASGILNSSSLIEQFTYLLREKTRDVENAKLKVKVHPLSHYDDLHYNPNSNPQTQSLLYDFLELPVLDLTDAKQPSVAGDTIKKLMHHTDNPEIKSILETLRNFADASKILSTFVSAFEKAILKADGHFYLHGSFNLGGTVSGRLSSSAPNLQNIPSTGSKYAKIVKDCFSPPKGWLFMGADFASLEDRISALTTNDSNKIKVYTDGYDGHSLRAFYYFPERCPGIVDTVESINSIKDVFPEVRQDSKAPTFLLTYGGTYHGLMNNVGLDKPVALSIEANYHKLYVESDEWVATKISQAAIDGYVTVAFGLRVRTPVIHQCVMNTSKTPYAAQAEARTAGNALGQSYGLLNNRAGIELQNRLFDSLYRYDILPMAHIHDAQYFIVRDNTDVVEWFNKNLVECMEWQDLPELEHPQVGLGGELSLFHPTWKTEIGLSNGANGKEIKAKVKKALQ
jgi:DNA polymerase-1